MARKPRSETPVETPVGPAPTTAKITPEVKPSEPEAVEVVVEKFYHTVNSNRFVQAGEHSIAFSPYEMVGGVWMGIYATSKKSEIAELDKLSEDKRSPVTAIERAEYDLCVKKKSKGQSPFGNSLLHQPVATAPAVAAPLDTEPVPGIPASALVPENPDDALKVAPV